MTDKITILIQSESTVNENALNDWVRAIPGVKVATNVREISLEMNDYYDIEEVTATLQKCPYATVIDAEVNDGSNVGVTEKGLEAIAGEQGSQDLSDAEREALAQKITDENKGNEDLGSEPAAIIEYSTDPKLGADVALIKDDNHSLALSLALDLDGNGYCEEITDEQQKAAQEAGLVVVYGESDDLIEFRGALYDEAGCYDGSLFVFDGDKFVDADVYDKDADGTESTIAAIWAPEDQDISWAYDLKNIDAYARFEIKEDDGVYGQGIVFHVSELLPELQVE